MLIFILCLKLDEAGSEEETPLGAGAGGSGMAGVITLERLDLSTNW
jgi:hypothetical protein